MQMVTEDISRLNGSNPLADQRISNIEVQTCKPQKFHATPINPNKNKKKIQSQLK
jgi:hypothetical protein